MSARGTSFVITGPSGSGKTTIAKRLTESLPGSVLLVTCTSRIPKSSEKDGENYIFMTRERFEEGIENNEFVEWSEQYGNYYGIHRKMYDEMISTRFAVFMTLSPDGARFFKENIPRTITVSIKVSDEDIRKRIMRDSELTPDQAEYRIEQALREQENCEEFDYCIPNPDGELDKSVIPSLKKVIEIELGWKNE